LYDGMQYTWKQYTYELDGIKHNALKNIEYLIENDTMYKIEREHENYVFAGSGESTDFSVCTMSKRDLDNYNDTSLITSYISLDGLSMFDIPNDANTEEIWNDDEYIYIGIIQDDVHCYRFPIEEMTNCVKVKYNDTYLSFATSPVIEDNRVLVPMRFLFEQMGADVDWNNSTRTATVEKDNDIISFSIDDDVAVVNGSQKIMDVPAQLINNTTMIPLRFLSEELGFNVEWDGERNMVIITE